MPGDVMTINYTFIPVILDMQIIARFTTGGGRQCSTDSALAQEKAHCQFSDLLASLRSLQSWKHQSRVFTLHRPV